MRSKPQFRDYSPPKSKADTNYEFSVEGGRKMTSIGNIVAGNALAKTGPTAMDWAVEPGRVGGLRRTLKARSELPRLPDGLMKR
jgi:hypothetical protein